MATTWFLCTAIAIILSRAQQYNTPLDNFIAENDPYYSWNYTGKSISGVGWDAYLINMTSQMWLNESYVNKPIWWHWLWIVLPTDLRHKNFATVVGTGGDNKNYDINSAPDRSDVFFIACQNIARDTGSICASLYQIPNEPLIFTQDPLQKSRSEDAIIAFGWNQFSKYPSSDNYRYNWLTHFPMTKATIRAMDTVSTFASSKLNIPSIENFGVSGASKRGWSAWLTAAADKRIKVMVPIVLDMLNFHPNLHHQYKAYGGWTFAFGDYYAENITQDLDDEWFEQLLQAADPYSFIDRYNERNLAKYIVDGTWDEFFMPDDEQFWWNDLQQPKYFLMNPDADHSQATAIETDIPSLTTFIGAYLNNVKLPIVEWEINNETGNNITIEFYGQTSNIIDAVIWHGRSCGRERRDFRMLTLDDPCYCGVQDGQYCFNLESLFVPINNIKPIQMNDTYAMYKINAPENPSSHWEAFMLGIKYKAFERNQTNNDNDNGNDKEVESWFLCDYGDMVFTTQISIVPNYFPFPDCEGESCKGTLV